MTTIADIKTCVDAVNAAYEARIQGAIVDNYDRKPTLDRSGRQHAPCDNYIWIDGNRYLGGQYLPEDEENTAKSYSVKIKIAKTVESQLQEIVRGSLGKTWIVDNTEIGYYYAQVTRAEKTALEKILPAVDRQIVLADEHTASKTWIFNTKKLIKSYVYKFGYQWQEMFQDFSHMDAPGVEFELVVKRDGKITFKSAFDGKSVCYVTAPYIAE